MATSYIYGRSSVLSALKYKRRILKALYLRDDSLSAGHYNRNTDIALSEATQLAKEASVPIMKCSLQELHKRSNGKPNNSMVLLAGELSLEKVSSISPPDEKGAFEFVLGKGRSISSQVTRRNPLVVALDRITDQENLGAILRSCSFFGAEGVIISEKGTAPLSPIVSKASAGSLESYPYLFQCGSLSKFLKRARECGWIIFGTDLNATNAIDLTEKSDLPPAPSILVLGNEGYGIRGLSDFCDVNLVIQGNDANLDSLNVSAAGAILIHSFRSKP